MLADPVGSILAEYMRSGTLGTAGSWAVEGIGEDFIPAIADLSACHARVFDPRRRELRHRARAAASAEGILGGSSTGTLLAAALRYCREQTEPKRVVSFVCDTGTRYLSKVYNDHWMIDQGLLARARYGDLRDLIARRAEDGSVVSVAPDDTLLTAFQRMRLADVSQLPVLDGEQLVGVIDESDLLLRVHATTPRASATGGQRDDRRARDAARPTPSLAAAASACSTAAWWRSSPTRAGFHGLITRFDLLNHLRRSAAMSATHETRPRRTASPRA